MPIETISQDDIIKPGGAPAAKGTGQETISPTDILSPAPMSTNPPGQEGQLSQFWNADAGKMASGLAANYAPNSKVAGGVAGGINAVENETNRLATVPLTDLESKIYQTTPYWADVMASARKAVMGTVATAFKPGQLGVGLGLAGATGGLNAAAAEALSKQQAATVAGDLAIQNLPKMGQYIKGAMDYVLNPAMSLGMVAGGAYGVAKGVAGGTDPDTGLPLSAGQRSFDAVAGLGQAGLGILNTWDSALKIYKLVKTDLASKKDGAGLIGTILANVTGKMSTTTSQKIAAAVPDIIDVAMKSRGTEDPIRLLLPPNANADQQIEYLQGLQRAGHQTLDSLGQQYAEAINDLPRDAQGRTGWTQPVEGAMDKVTHAINYSSSKRELTPQDLASGKVIARWNDGGMTPEQYQAVQDILPDAFPRLRKMGVMQPGKAYVSGEWTGGAGQYMTAQEAKDAFGENMPDEIASLFNGIGTPADQELTRYDLDQARGTLYNRLNALYTKYNSGPNSKHDALMNDPVAAGMHSLVKAIPKIMDSSIPEGFPGQSSETIGRMGGVYSYRDAFNVVLDQYQRGLLGKNKGSQLARGAIEAGASAIRGGPPSPAAVANVTQGVNNIKSSTPREISDAFRFELDKLHGKQTQTRVDAIKSATTQLSQKYGFPAMVGSSAVSFANQLVKVTQPNQ